MSKSDLFERIEELSAQDIDYTNLEEQVFKEFEKEVAVVVGDSTGFTRTTKKRGIVYFLAIIVKLRKLTAEIFNTHSVQKLRFEADNLYGEFTTVDDALAASIKLRQKLNEEKYILYDDDYFQTCIGIGFGRMLDADQDGVFGEEMNIASKLGEDTAEGGEILLSTNAFQNLKHKNRYNFRLEDIVVSGTTIQYYSLVTK